MSFTLAKMDGSPFCMEGQAWQKSEMVQTWRLEMERSSALAENETSPAVKKTSPPVENASPYGQKTQTSIEKTSTAIYTEKSVALAAMEETLALVEMETSSVYLDEETWKKSSMVQTRWLAMEKRLFQLADMEGSPFYLEV
jgi:hypothetical protein